MKPCPIFPKVEATLGLVCSLALLQAAATARMYQMRDEEPIWNIPAAHPIPHPNGYDLYLAGAKTSVRFTPPVDAVLDAGDVELKSAYALKNYSLARRQKWLQANATSFSWIDKGLKTPSLAPQNNGFAPSDWGKFMDLANQMVARTDTFQMQRQPLRATMSALDTMQMGQDVTRGGNYGARLASMGISRIGRGPLDDWNKTINALSGVEARRCTRRLEALLSREPTTTQMLTVEKREQLLQLRRIWSNPNWRQEWLSKRTIDQLNEPLSKQDIYNTVNNTIRAEIAWTKQPYSRAKVVLPMHGLNDLTKHIVIGSSSVSHYVEIKALHENANTMLLLRLALRAYTAEHGQTPPTLSALVPTYLKSIPTDVYNDGKPLFYTAHGKTYKLWSVGPDGINNGGIPLTRTFLDKPTLPTVNFFESKGDFVAGQCR